jgi:hypothetical protein
MQTARPTGHAPAPIRCNPKAELEPAVCPTHRLLSDEWIQPVWVGHSCPTLLGLGLVFGIGITR